MYKLKQERQNRVKPPDHHRVYTSKHGRLRAEMFYARVVELDKSL